jgi:hypothetical protein
LSSIVQFDFSQGGSWRLYRVVLNIGPLGSHKLTSPGEPALICLWLFAKSHDDAGRRARIIAGQLPFELVDDEAIVFETNDPDEKPEFLSHEQIAREAGFSFVVVSVGSKN